MNLFEKVSPKIWVNQKSGHLYWKSSIPLFPDLK